jgi:hypothetical protein
MAKQTFTTGQVLTAAQMTSLQQTAMLGGSASAKVASYTLVAADAGTTVSMSNAGATTITVNTGLFAAGDTVTILNVGVGTCTITAGTATVSKPTNATLALVTNAGGVLYFTATGAATFLPFDVGSASSSPLTTKGDLFGYDTANARIPIGTNNQVLTADSTQALGLKWATAASPSYTYTDYTPTLGQNGAVTKTVNTARYVQIGKFVHAYGTLTVTGTGNANQIVQIGYPVANAYNSLDGFLSLYDTSSGLNYKGIHNAGPFTSMNSTSNSGVGVADFTAALAAGDVLYFNFYYESV